MKRFIGLIIVVLVLIIPILSTLYLISHPEG